MKMNMENTLGEYAFGDALGVPQNLPGSISVPINAVM
jgi:hypothetical protein